jgi:hypothetical protein
MLGSTIPPPLTESWSRGDINARLRTGTLNPDPENTSSPAEGLLTEMLEAANVYQPSPHTPWFLDTAKSCTGCVRGEVTKPQVPEKSVGVPIVNRVPAREHFHCSSTMATPSPRRRGMYGVASTPSSIKGLAERLAVMRYLPDIPLRERMMEKVAFTGIQAAKATWVTRPWYCTLTRAEAFPRPPLPLITLQDSISRL